MDGYVAGPYDSGENPLGDDGERVTDWMFDLASEYDRHTYRDPDRLRQLYYGEALTLSEIADRFGISQNAISDQMRVHGPGPGH